MPIAARKHSRLNVQQVDDPRCCVVARLRRVGHRVAFLSQVVSSWTVASSF